MIMMLNINSPATQIGLIVLGAVAVLYGVAIFFKGSVQF